MIRNFKKYNTWLKVIAIKPDTIACEQQRRNPACASVQSNQCRCYSLSGQKKYLSCRWPLSSFVAEQTRSFEFYLVGNTECLICFVSHALQKHKRTKAKNNKEKQQFSNQQWKLKTTTTTNNKWDICKNVGHQTLIFSFINHYFFFNIKTPL